MIDWKEKEELKELYDSIPDYSDDELELMTEDSLLDYYELKQQAAEFKRYNKILYFKPDDWFLGASEKLIDEPVVATLCGNRMGKSYSATWLYACHLTGYYPSWFKGYKYESQIDTWYLTSTAEQAAQSGGLQEYLLGAINDIGSGWIPKDCIAKTEAGIGVKGFIKKSFIEHVSGELSTMEMKSYSQNIIALMGASISFALIDEECPWTVLTQVVTRTSTPKTGKGTGRVLVAATPEQGMSETVQAFWDGCYKDGCVRATVWDCSFLTDEDIDNLKKRYPPHQHDMRLKGIPTLGAGAVYPYEESFIKVYDVEIQPHWKVAAAIDWGFKPDPCAILFGAYDPESGKSYIFKEFYETEKTFTEIGGWIKKHAPGIPVIYPGDGNTKRIAADGKTYQQLLADEGVNIKETYRVKYGNLGRRETGHTQLREMFRSGMLKVTNNCVDWFKEYRIYQYDDKGSTNHCPDHAMDATRYLFQRLDQVGIRWEDCKTQPQHNKWNGSKRKFSRFQ